MRRESLRLRSFQVPPTCFRRRGYTGSNVHSVGRFSSRLAAVTISRRFSHRAGRTDPETGFYHYPAFAPRQGLHVPCPSDQPCSFLFGWQPSFRGELIDHLGQILAEPIEQFLARHP